MVSPDKIVVYSTQNCGYCRAATHFLRNVKDVDVEVTDAEVISSSHDHHFHSSSSHDGEHGVTEGSLVETRTDDHRADAHSVEQCHESEDMIGMGMRQDDGIDPVASVGP